MSDLKRFVIGFLGALSVLILGSAALVVPRRRAARPEEVRFFVPQADPLFRAEVFDGLVTTARVTVLGTSSAETSFNPSLYSSLTGQPALNLGTAGTCIAGSAPTAAYLAHRWTALHTATIAREAVFIITEHELQDVERLLGRYACGGSECFTLWHGAAIPEILKQEAAWVERSARLSVGWDLRSLTQSLLSSFGRARATWSEERCAAFDDHISLEDAKQVPARTYCARGYTLMPAMIPPKANPSPPARPWGASLADPMSGLNVLARQIAVLRQAGVRVTVVLFDAADRNIQPETLIHAQRVLAGARVCHYQPGPTGYSDEQHLSVLGAARLTRWLALGDAGSDPGSGVTCF